MVCTLVNPFLDNGRRRTRHGWCACGSISRGTTIIGLAVQCPDGKYFGSIRAPGPVYDHVLELLKQNYGRRLREVMDAEIDISDVIQGFTPQKMADQRDKGP